MIHDWEVCGDVVQILSGPSDFYQMANAAVYETIIELYEEHHQADIVILNDRLRDKGILQQIGGTDKLIELGESVPSSAGFKHYAGIVRDKAVLRKLIETAGLILHQAYESSDPVNDLLDLAERHIFEIADHKTISDAADLNSLLQETYEKLESDEGLASSGLKTGYYELDEMTNGLHDGELIIIAARPSMGKTAFMLNIAEHLAAGARQPVAVFSLEMSKQQLAQRLLCSRSGVDSQKLRRNMLSAEDMQQLMMAVGELGEAPMFIDDTPGLSLLNLRAKARRLAARHHIKAVFVDYLQLMSAPGSESRQQEVSSISRGLKALARELEVPVICLSQLNRQAEGREGHRPRMSDLRESGAIEQDADVIAFVHREDYYHKGEEDYTPNHQAEIILAKQRNGPTGVVKLQFHGPTTRFNNLAMTDASGF